MVHPGEGLLQDATGSAPLPQHAAKAQQVRYSLGVKGEACSTAPFDKAMNNLNTIGHRAVSIARADWGPQIRRAVHAALSVVAFVYVCGSIVGRCAYDLGRITREAVEERNDQLAVALVAFLGLQRATAPAPAPVAPVATPEPARVIVQRQAPAPAAIEPPAALGPVRRLKAQGLSQRQIAIELGLTRYQVRRQLAAT